jgi:glycosyltransferase involved in cell wall biosynthesis
VSSLDVSLIFPAYNDESTIRIVAEQGLQLLADYATKFEIIIVDDGSPDRSGEIADGLAAEHPGIVSVIHHLQNRGYGAALRTGMAASRYDWICVVDGDNEYAVSDLRKMLEIRNFYRLIIAFRYKKLYSTSRIFISFVYNFLLRRMFRTPFRDVSTGIRTFHRSILSEIELTSDSPFIGAELAIKAMLRGFPVGELGIQTFPRSFGRGAAVSPKNIVRTIRDMIRVRNEIFSDTYDLPAGRSRSTSIRRRRSLVLSARKARPELRGRWLKRSEGHDGYYKDQ